ncbi:acetate/propionate family kinase [Ampullimonas aquatilis]|uniref:acetate/propionate family kinase n=1 Tax=Ampullimonas aquatilis TaxID=1341549 RepID=UPI003C78BDBE
MSEANQAISSSSNVQTKPVGLILVINAGSTSLKFGVYAVESKAHSNFQDQAKYATPIEWVRGTLSKQGNGWQIQMRAMSDMTGNHATPLPDLTSHTSTSSAALLDCLSHLFSNLPLLAVGHRVVHGGDRFREHVRITPAILPYLHSLEPLAPQHQPHNLQAIEDLLKSHPNLPQVACFDTAFHTTQDRLARMYALPRALYDQGYHRFGFHGLSYEFISEQMAKLAPELSAKRMVIAHLGGGASICGLINHQSRACSMGFTALDGLVMASRSGSIDPGLLIHLLKSGRYDLSGLEHLLYDQSGLMGVSGISNDMRTLVQSDDPAAQEAVALFVRRAARELAAIICDIGGLDLLVFTGGIGEHQAIIRQKIIDSLSWLGLKLDGNNNQQLGDDQSGCISRSDQAVPVWVMPTNEECVIAEDTLRLSDIQPVIAQPSIK